MRIIVTGGAGFIGSAVCRHLVTNEHCLVLNVDKLTYAANLQSLAAIEHNKNYAFVRADVCDRAAIDRILAQFLPDAIMHLAAESHVDRSITGSAEFVRTNVLGTHTMLEAARAYWSGLSSNAQNNFRFLHISTDEVYGSLCPTGYFVEKTPYDPSSPYSASKAASDHLVSTWHKTYSLPTIISNCSNNYGPYHFPEKLIPLAIVNALERKPLPVYGDGQNVRDWLYVDDHVKALTTIIRHGRPGHKYNIGGRNERTNLQVVGAICDIVDVLLPSTAPRRELIEFVEDRPGHDRRYAVDCSKVEKELGWKPSESFETGLHKTVLWYLENREWWQPLRERAYGGERLGLINACV